MSQTSVGSAPAFDLPRPALAHLATMPRVDLMPLEVAQDAALRRLKTGCAAAIVVSVVAVASLMVQGHNAVNDRKHDVADAQQVQDRVQSQVSALAPVAATYASVTGAKALEAQALGGEVRWSQQLLDLSLSIPAGVWVTNMSVSAAGGPTATSAASATATPAIATITFQGVALQGPGNPPAPARDRIATWLEFLTGQKGYTNATYTTSQEALIGSQVVVNFTSTVSVTSAALSQRYTNTNGG